MVRGSNPATKQRWLRAWRRVERLNRSFREKVLDGYLFDSVEQVREITEAWPETYNTARPYDSLGQVPPLTFLLRPDAASKSIFEVRN